MTVMSIITWVALFGIGFWAGMKYAQNKYQPQIKRMRQHINDLENPEPPTK